MTKKSNRSTPNGFIKMKKTTRDFFYSTFSRADGALDKQKAADFFGVTLRTISNWWSTGSPAWVDGYVRLYQRSIPDTKDWDGFRFSHDRKELLTPYERHSFTPQRLLMDFYNKQFDRHTRTENRQLNKQVEALRNDEEAAAIRSELDNIISTINKLKNSPVVAPKKAYSETIIRQQPKMNTQQKRRD
ncbi:DUF3653 domain-containing protein [Shewanella baltica]|uniref:DUF3653 domain-containing protein n=1 Tax=Shewanella baltica TaxID=62322 RepID=UPI003D7B1E80